jgi:ubiquinone/menaquinone biosynthesis C-methylase UbiE
MTFAAPAESYDRYMGRWSRRLAPLMADFAGVEAGMQVLDVGAGPGSLTEHLAARVGAERAAAAEPSRPFAEACAAAVPGADVRAASAEHLPWEDGAFDAVLSQLVVNFLDDPAQGAREMRRVARRGGTVAACVWDYAEMGMLRTFWDAALALDRDAPAEHLVMGFGKPDELQALWRSAGLDEIATLQLEVAEEYADFDDYWEPFTAGVGPGGGYCAALPADAREALREQCRRRLGDPAGAFRLEARATAVRGRA